MSDSPLSPAEQIAILETGLLAAAIALESDEDGSHVPCVKEILATTFDKSRGVLGYKEARP